MTAAVKTVTIRLRKTRRTFAWKCSCGRFESRLTEQQMYDTSEGHVQWHEGQLSQFVVVEAGGLT